MIETTEGQKVTKLILTVSYLFLSCIAAMYLTYLFKSDSFLFFGFLQPVLFGALVLCGLMGLFIRGARREGIIALLVSLMWFATVYINQGLPGIEFHGM